MHGGERVLGWLEVKMIFSTKMIYDKKKKGVK